MSIFEGSARPDFMPYSILMEIALQTCGVLTTWNKAPLTLARTCNTDNILFRNLDATARLLRNVDLRGKTIRNESTATGYPARLQTVAPLPPLPMLSRAHHASCSRSGTRPWRPSAPPRESRARPAGRSVAARRLCLMAAVPSVSVVCTAGTRC